MWAIDIQTSCCTTLIPAPAKQSGQISVHLRPVQRKGAHNVRKTIISSLGTCKIKFTTCLKVKINDKEPRKNQFTEIEHSFCSV